MTKKKESILTLEKEDDKMIRKLAWRSMIGSGTYNYENMQGLVFLYAMIPVINRYYRDKEDRIAAYERHFTLFNITPAFFGFVTGLAASMEKIASEDENFDISSIGAIKSSLMGPLSGIGDSIFWGALKVVATGVGVQFALQGNVLGPILYFLINFIPGMMAKLWLPRISFKFGIGFLEKMEANGTLALITKLCNIVGLLTIGAMATTMVKVNFISEWNVEGNVLNLQNVIDSILPKMLPVGLTLIMFKYLNKNVKPIVLMLILIVLCTLGSYFGIL